MGGRGKISMRKGKNRFMRAAGIEKQEAAAKTTTTAGYAAVFIKCQLVRLQKYTRAKSRSTPDAEMNELAEKSRSVQWSQKVGKAQSWCVWGVKCGVQRSAADYSQLCIERPPSASLC